MAWTPDRRSVLLAAVAIGLIGCGPGQPDASEGSEAPTTPAPDKVTMASLPPAHSQTEGSPAQQQDTLITRDDVIKTYSKRTAEYWGLEAPGVLTKLPAPVSGVALTFDFCGGTGGNSADHALLATLRQQHIPATLFLNSQWITANQALATELAADPLFELANHGTTHRPLSVSGRNAYGIPGTRNPAEVYDEIMINNALLTELTGKRPLFFRPGTAYLDEVSSEIVRSLGLIPVGFSINGDAGATLPATTVSREISRARSGDIVIAHGNHPGSGTAHGLMSALALMKDRGETFLPRLQAKSA